MPKLPQLKYVGSMLDKGWIRPTTLQLQEYQLYLALGLAPHTALHLESPAVGPSRRELKHKVVREGMQLLRDFTDPASNSQLTAVGMAYPQLNRAESNNLRILAAQREMKNLRGENRTSDVAVLVSPRYEGIPRAGTTVHLEACCSIPGIGYQVERWNEIILYLPGQKPQRVSGTYAHILQHEIDHLDGLLGTAMALAQRRRLYFVPPEWRKLFFRGSFTPEWPEFPVDQYLAMRSGKFDLARYLPRRP